MRISLLSVQLPTFICMQIVVEFAGYVGERKCRVKEKRHVHKNCQIIFPLVFAFDGACGMPNIYVIVDARATRRYSCYIS